MNMKVILHDLPEEYTESLQKHCDTLIHANGKYAPCQGCFGCWTKHPAECYLKDSLHTVCRTIGRADALVIITRNCYGMYSTAVKNIFILMADFFFVLISLFEGGLFRGWLKKK